MSCAVNWLMIETKEAQEARIFALKTEIDKLDGYINSVNNPEYARLPRGHKQVLNRKLYALRSLLLELTEESKFLN